MLICTIAPLSTLQCDDYLVGTVGGRSLRMNDEKNKTNKCRRLRHDTMLDTSAGAGKTRSRAWDRKNLSSRKE